MGRLLANPVRAAMLDLLLDGRAITSGELARETGISPSTASGHLADLTSGGLVTRVAQGRHRYFTLSGADVASALESLSHVCPASPVRSLRQSNQARALSVLRSCYDHLAGAVAVDIFDVLLGRQWLTSGTDGYVLSPVGAGALEELGVDIEGAARRRRHFARPCPDWTERRPHLAGALGAAVMTTLLDREWVERRSKSRALRLTESGRSGLCDFFGIDPPPDR